MSNRSVQLSSSPLLASKTPVWRSKFIVAAIALGFLGLVGRAAYVQEIANDFFLRQGEVRFARTLSLPANRGRVLDRNGMLLASSVPAPSVWASPEDIERDAFDALSRHAIARDQTGAVVATGSARRRAQLARLRPDLEFAELRGNMATRLAKLWVHSHMFSGYLADVRCAHPREPPSIHTGFFCDLFRNCEPFFFASSSFWPI